MRKSLLHQELEHKVTKCVSLRDGDIFESSYNWAMGLSEDNMYEEYKELEDKGLDTIQITRHTGLGPSLKPLKNTSFLGRTPSQGWWRESR